MTVSSSLHLRAANKRDQQRPTSTSMTPVTPVTPVTTMTTMTPWAPSKDSAQPRQQSDAHRNGLARRTGHIVDKLSPPTQPKSYFQRSTSFACRLPNILADPAARTDTVADGQHADGEHAATQEFYDDDDDDDNDDDNSISLMDADAPTQRRAAQTSANDRHSMSCPIPPSHRRLISELTLGSELDDCGSYNLEVPDANDGHDAHHNHSQDNRGLTSTDFRVRQSETAHSSAPLHFSATPSPDLQVQTGLNDSSRKPIVFSRPIRFDKWSNASHTGLTAAHRASHRQAPHSAKAGDSSSGLPVLPIRQESCHGADVSIDTISCDPEPTAQISLSTHADAPKHHQRSGLSPPRPPPRSSAITPSPARANGKPACGTQSRLQLISHPISRSQRCDDGNTRSSIIINNDGNNDNRTLKISEFSLLAKASESNSIINASPSYDESVDTFGCASESAVSIATNSEVGDCGALHQFHQSSAENAVSSRHMHRMTDAETCDKMPSLQSTSLVSPPPAATRSHTPPRSQPRTQPGKAQRASASSYFPPRQPIRKLSPMPPAPKRPNPASAKDSASSQPPDEAPDRTGGYKDRQGTMNDEQRQRGSTQIKDPPHDRQSDARAAAPAGDLAPTNTTPASCDGCEQKANMEEVIVPAPASSPSIRKPSEHLQQQPTRILHSSPRSVVVANLLADRIAEAQQRHFELLVRAVREGSAADLTR